MLIDQITSGGLKKGELNVILCGIGVGKSVFHDTESSEPSIDLSRTLAEFTCNRCDLSLSNCKCQGLL